MDMMLEGKCALVTGNTSGIGAECARFLAAEGVRVVVHGRNEDRAKQVVDGIVKSGGRARAVIGDLNITDDFNRVVNDAGSAYGGVDILVNNVGNPVSESHPSWFDASIDEWMDDYRQNTIAAVRLIHAFAPGMKSSGWGRLIQVSSRNAISPHALFPTYGSAKAAVNNMTLSLSKELAGTGVTSNAIMPGLIDTPQLASWFTEMAKRQTGSGNPEIGKAFVLKNVVQQTVNRLGRPSDIAAAVCFVASPLSDFMTGTIFRVDGGATPTL